jgi:hypothetical protein
MNRKYNKGIWILGGLVFFLILVIFSNLFEEKKEREMVKEKIQEENKFIQEFNQKNKGKNISNFPSNQKEKISEKEEFDNLPDNKPISIPYTEPLPPTPDPQLVKEYFIDQNNNGVRDDIEIEIVQEFEEDRDVVEAFFAEARVQEYILILSEEVVINKENLQEVLDYTDYFVRCTLDIYKKSVIGERFGFEPNSFISKYDLTNIYFNTEKRKIALNQFLVKLSGHFTNIKSINKDSCQNFFQKTKELIPESRRYVAD